jgi:hypothetical protein
MNTLLLNPNTWDLLIDSNGNIAMAQEPYANAQDVASALRLFKGELRYDTSKGVPYFDTILGQIVPPQVIMSEFEIAALTVPNIVSAKATIEVGADRVAVGTVQVINSVGQASNVQFT